MYSVSEAYLDQMMKRSTRRRLTGSIGSVPFVGSDVVQNSFNVYGKATEKSDTKIGGVYLGELEMSFVPSFLEKLPLNQFKDKELTVNIGLLINEENEEPYWLDIPVGVYTLKAPRYSKEGISVEGYDHMKKLDKTFNIDATTGTPYDFLSYIATSCSVQLGNTQEEIEAMANGTEILGLYEDNNIETFRDFLHWVSQALGGFAYADRFGRICIGKLGNPTNVEFDEEHRDADVVFSAYITKWTGIYVTDIATQTAMYYGLEQDDGLTMSLGANPLLQVGSADAVERRRRNVLNAISLIRYTPFYCNSARDPIFDLGDEIPFTGGISNNAVGCVMSYSYSLYNYTYEGFGDEPDLANARSKVDKNISGLLQSTAENEVTYYNFANLQEITFGSEEEVTLASLAFVSAQKTTIKILHEFIFDMLADLGLDNSYEIRYYLDEELIDYKPYERLSPLNISSEIPTEEGSDPEIINADIDPVNVSITRDFFYVVKDIEPNERHTWQVRIITHNIESTTIGIDHAHVTIEGQRMYGEEFFDGYVEVREDFSLIPFGCVGVLDLEDTFEGIELTQATIATGSDTVGLVEFGSVGVLDFDDDLQVFMEGGFYIATEDGKIITTEDGKRIITE